LRSSIRNITAQYLKNDSLLITSNKWPTVQFRNGLSGNLKEMFLKCGRDVLKIIFDNYGTIYGRYLRDIIANVKPNDIDIFISKGYQHSFADYDSVPYCIGIVENPDFILKTAKY
jgi:hypothetical protein